MKKTLAILALAALLGGCTGMKNAGIGLCKTQTEISAGVTEIGAMFGMPGNGIARALNIILETGCNIIGGAVALPANTTDDVMGLFSSLPEKAAAAANHNGN